MDNMFYLIEDDINLDQIVQESYKGKSKQLLELEKMIGENRKKYYGSFKVGGGYYTDKDFIKIGDKIAKIFNFKVVDFNLVNDPTLNAFTIPAGFSISANTKSRNSILTSNKEDTMKFKYNELSTVIRVTSGLWTSKQFTDGEITSIIVHEVGHNFQHEVNSGLRMYSSCLWFVSMFQIILLICSGQIFTAVKSLIDGDSDLRAAANDYAKNSGVGNIINVAGSIVGFIKVITYEVLEFIGRITLGIPTGIINMSSIIISGINSPISLLVKMATNPIGKGMENVSDVWAAEHGYGPELISALAKMDVDPDASATAVDRISKKLPLFDSLCTLFGLPMMIVSSLFESHPVTGKRASNIVYELERDLEKSDVSPAMKKEIKKQIEEVKEAINKYSKVDNPMEGTAMRKALLKFSANFDRDPKGFIAREFSKKNLIEAFYTAGDDEFLNEIEVDLNDLL